MITCTFEKGYQAKLRHVVVHMIVEKDGSLLLEKRTGDLLESGKWGLPSGFLERDETAGEGALRELFEETGWTGRIAHVLRINTKPNRPHEDRQNISIDFIVTPIERTGIPDAESSKVEWIPFTKLLPLEEYAFDHGESIALYLKWKKEQFSLPLFE
jgi:ADP-ribose pyrophosphatase YjhB (NUDIX family)